MGVKMEIENALAVFVLDKDGTVQAYVNGKNIAAYDAEYFAESFNKIIEQYRE